MLLLFTGGCALSDIKKRRISNRFLLIGGLLFWLMWFAQGLKTGWTTGRAGMAPGLGAAFAAGVNQGGGYLLRAGALLCILFPMYLFRMMGAGDIKMAAVLFGGAGVRQGGTALVCGLVIAGIWSVFLLLRHGIAGQRIRYLAFYLRQFSPGEKAEPYYLEERDGKEVSFCMAPCLFLGVIGAEVIQHL